MLKVLEDFLLSKADHTCRDPRCRLYEIPCKIPRGFKGVLKRMITTRDKAQRVSPPEGLGEFLNGPAHHFNPGDWDISQCR